MSSALVDSERAEQAIALRSRINSRLYPILKPFFVRLGWVLKPSFLIIGAQKAGTTALHRYLQVYPRIEPAKGKELHYFSQERAYQSGESFYHSFFPTYSRLANFYNPDSRKITYESTPNYIYHPQAAERIHAYNPDIKLIVILREPIARAFSSYQMMLKWRQTDFVQRVRAGNRRRRYDDELIQAYKAFVEAETPPSFEVMIRAEIDSIKRGDRFDLIGLVGMGMYAVQLERFFRFFRREQILILDSELLRQQRAETLDTVLNFLCLAPYNWPAQEINLRYHSGEYKESISSEAYDLLHDFYGPHDQQLFELIGRVLSWG